MLQRPVPSFRSQVADHYRRKGYEVREAPKVRGQSGQVYAVDLVCEGPLGAILVSFGDAGGVDGAEVGRVRILAKDIGANPAIAAESFDPDVARLAAQMGVALVDATAAAGILPPPIPEPIDFPERVTPRSLDEDLRAHPWPRSGTIAGSEPLRTSDVDELVASIRAPAAATARPPSAAAQALWRTTAGPQPAPAAPAAPSVRSEPFAWLKAQAKEAVAEVRAETATVPPATAAAATSPVVVHEEPRRIHWLRWAVAAVAVLGIVMLARGGFFSA